MQEMDIAEVARRSGLAASALRHYESVGLIRAIGRRGLRRVFDAGVLEQLALIALGRAAGMTLQDIGALLGTARAGGFDRAQLSARADALDRSIQTMIRVRDGLRHAAACRASSHLACPRFRALMRRAAGPR
ncbi:MerR family transcriptional regulator [Stenotrophomonas sp.]|uniref:MerR family transcriptional regulator n=1 Tax=Stenotrophomonas sp. TaxID=69392 RepID=UPI0028AB9300|nr:MerR family transcriptional regulator [Stenotrophomonas sp.]